MSCLTYSQFQLIPLLDDRQSTYLTKLEKRSSDYPVVFCDNIYFSLEKIGENFGNFGFLV